MQIIENKVCEADLDLLHKFSTKRETSKEKFMAVRRMHLVEELPKNMNYFLCMRKKIWKGCKFLRLFQVLKQELMVSPEDKLAGKMV